MPLTSTHTVTTLEVSKETYDEIATKLREAGYDHLFDINGLIDMYGIGLVKIPEPLPVKKVDPRDPDYSRQGMFVYHNCSRCNNGEKPCIRGKHPRDCEFPHARND